MYISTNKQLSRIVLYLAIIAVAMAISAPVLYAYRAYNTVYLVLAVFMYILVYLLYKIYRGVEALKHDLYRSVVLVAKFLADLIPVFIITYLLIGGFAYLVHGSLQELYGFPQISLEPQECLKPQEFLEPNINLIVQWTIYIVLLGSLSYAISIILLRKFSRRFNEYLSEINSLLWIWKYVYHFIMLTIVLALSNVIIMEYLDLYRLVGAVMVFLVPIYMLGRLTSRR